MGEAITGQIKQALLHYLDGKASPELVEAYLFFLERKYNLAPVVFPRERKIYRSADEAVAILDAQDKLCNQTQIKITFGEPAVNEQTTKVYICPFSGKVFGNNTHPNPQDAIYDWVSKCPENTERVNGLRVKRFYISEDPEVMRSYLAKNKTKEPITKIVYTSVLSGKLFHSKEAVIDDFRKHYLKKISLVEGQNQNKFDFEEKFMEFLQKQLEENLVAGFVEKLAEDEEFLPYVQHWLNEEAEEEEVEEEEEEAADEGEEAEV